MHKTQIWSYASWLRTNCRFIRSRLNNDKLVKRQLHNKTKLKNKYIREDIKVTCTKANIQEQI